MSRIAKSHVNAAFEWAAAQIAEAGGRDGITSRAEIRRRIGELTGPERDLVDFFYRFIVRQGAAHNERVTRADVDAALALARKDMVAAFDTNDNGLSSDEVAAMPPLGRLAVKVARHYSGRNAIVAFNKRLNDRLSLVYEQGITVATNVLRLEYTLTQSITLRAETGTASGLGIAYRRSFD